MRANVGEITQTDFGYTFQRSLPGTGLMDYRARFYSAALGRFIQPDSIVPGAENPQAWNRYTYVSNSPINRNDPSGHWEDEGGGAPDDDDDIIDGPGGDEDDNGGSGGGGGGNGKDNPRGNNYYVRSDPTLYLLGWENFETAWSIWTNSDFNYWQRFGAGAYMGAWGGAHVGLLVGAAGMACVAAGPGCVQVVEGALGIGTVLGADGDPTNEITAITRYFPPNRGFSVEPIEYLTKTGEIISRIGGPDGRFFSPAGVPRWALSLPPGLENAPEHLYRVVNPFTVYAGPATTWFGQPGGGMQYYSILSVKSLEMYGYLEPILK